MNSYKKMNLYFFDISLTCMLILISESCNLNDSSRYMKITIMRLFFEFFFRNKIKEIQTRYYLYFLYILRIELNKVCVFSSFKSVFSLYLPECYDI